MSERPSSLESLPSYGEGFKDYQRSAIPSSFARFDSKVGGSEEAGASQSTKIRQNANILAFQPRGRERVEREPKPTKKATGRKRAKDKVVVDEEVGENGDETQISRRTRPTRRAAPKQFNNVGDAGDSDDADFM